MKPLFYAGALLMVSASIYGFVDYKKTSRDNRFKTLYQEEKREEVPASVPVKQETPETTALVQNTRDIKEVSEKNVQKAKKHTKAKKFNTKLYSRAALETYEPVNVKEISVTPEVKEEK